MPTALKIILGSWLIVCGLLTSSFVFAQEGQSCNPNATPENQTCLTALPMYCEGDETLRGTNGVCSESGSCQYTYGSVSGNPLRCKDGKPYQTPPSVSCTPTAAENECIGGTRYCVDNKTISCTSSSCNESTSTCDYSNCLESTANELGCTNGQPTLKPNADAGGLRQPEAPSAKNWDPIKQMTYSGHGLVGMFSCLGFNIPFGTDGCPNVLFTPQGFKTQITYNGEGGGAMGAATSMMAFMHNNRPASGTEYLANIYKKGVRLGEPAYAQVLGSGAEVISPVYRIWQVMRNISYLFFILIFVVVGFMIMFRSKLNPQTVISVQNALPGLVTALIFVTFSYFIAGLIIDMAFVLSQAIGVLFLSTLGTSGPNSWNVTQNLLNGRNILNFFADFAFNPDLFAHAGTIGGQVTNFLYTNTTNRLVLGGIGAIAACLNPAGLGLIATTGPAGLAICGGLGAAGGSGITPITGTIVSSVVYFTFLFALLIAMFRLLFGLIGNYVGIIIQVIFGPLIIMTSAFPGRGGNFTNWWRCLLANVLAFPAVFGAFLLSGAIMGYGDPYFLNGTQIGQFNQVLPLFANSPVGFIPILIAYGVLIATPAIPEFIRSSMGCRPGALGQAAEGGIRGAVPLGQATTGLVFNTGRRVWTRVRRAAAGGP